MSKGLSKAIVFHGLEYAVVVHPTIHGDPILTSQGFYYLEQMESVAEIRFESGEPRLSDNQIEYLIDNYLFEYSIINEGSQLNTKVTNFKYSRVNSSDIYPLYDQFNTRALLLDELNDTSILSIKSLEGEPEYYFYDYCLVKAYSDDMIRNHVNGLSQLLDKKLLVKMLPTEDRNGYFGKMRLLKCDDGLIDYYQANRFEYGFGPRDIKPDQGWVTLCSEIEGVNDFELPIETIYLDRKYNPVLLPFYFSGLKEVNPLLSFIGFYNVLEYYFEEAPILLSKKARGEREQLECVLLWLVTDRSITEFITLQSSEFNSILEDEIRTSSSVSIKGLDIKSGLNLVQKLSIWIYSIRCAVIHSKKSRNNKEVAIFKPYSEEVNNMAISLPVIKWLAIKCIQKDSELNGFCDL
jgi:hypothetical protein